MSDLSRLTLCYRTNTFVVLRWIFAAKPCVLRKGNCVLDHIITLSYERNGVSNYWQLDCLSTCLFMLTTTKIQIRITACMRGVGGVGGGIHRSPVNSLDKATRACCNAESVYMAWRHNVPSIKATLEHTRRSLQWRFMGSMACEITGNPTVCLVICSVVHQIKHQGSAILAHCEGKPPLTGRFPVQRTSNAENVSKSLRHHAIQFFRDKRQLELIKHSKFSDVKSTQNML